MRKPHVSHSHSHGYSLNRAEVRNNTGLSGQ